MGFTQMARSSKEEVSSKAEEVPQLEAREFRTDNASHAAELANQVGDIECSPWTKSMFRLYGCLLVSYFCGCLNGYDGSLMGGLNAMRSYQNFFHM